MMPVLLHCVKLVVEPTGKLKAEAKSLNLLGDVVAVVQEGKFRNPQPERLKELARRHYDGFFRTYGTEECKPKHHYT